jgi:hypothetical protein
MAESGNPGSLAAARAPNTFSLPVERSENNPASAGLQVHAGPSPEAKAECDEFILDEIFRDLDLTRSYVTIGLEAAHFGERAELRLRLQLIRDHIHHAIQSYKLLSPEPSQGRGS